MLAAGRLPDEPTADAQKLSALLAEAKAGDYIALMGYLAPSIEVDDAVAELRETLMRATKLPVTFGYGPRFLHSTGQLHKGGPPRGRFLSLLVDSEADVEIPGQEFGFRTLKDAQALGDLQTLRKHALPAELVRDSGDPAQAVRKLHEQIRGIL